MALIIPTAIAQILADFDQRSTPFDRVEVLTALQAARQSLGALSDDQQKGAWAEILAFALVNCDPRDSPWSTHFGPIASGEYADGTAFYSPDISQADAEILEHWCSRSQSLTHPALRARYADLCWDLSKTIAGINGVFSDVKLAIDSYIEAASTVAAANLHQGFEDGARALQLAIQINDSVRIPAAKQAVLALHFRAMSEGTLWWQAYDILVQQRKAGLSDSERSSLVCDLESMLVHHSNAADPNAFDPHFVKMTADRLSKHYERTGQVQDAGRCHATVARAAEHHASLGNALLASAVLQSSMEAYRKAGMSEEVERIRREMAVKSRQAQSEMTAIQEEFTVTFDKVEEFLSGVIKPSADATLQAIAVGFLLKRAPLEALIEEGKREAPLYSMITQSIFDGDHVVATVGSAEDDPNGHLLRRAVRKVMFDTPFLGWAMKRAIEVHRLKALEFARFANRAGLFGDGLLLQDGLEAYFDGDFVKAVHVLVPQIERGFRNLIEVAGGASTKPHPRFSTAQVVITMGDIMHDKILTTKFGTVGEGISLQIATLYADSRARNVRNDLAHGILDRQDMTQELTHWLIHSALLLGSLANRSPEQAT